MSDKTPLSEYRQEDFDQMNRITDALINATAPFRENTDPILFLLALVLTTRRFLDAAPPDAKKTLLPILVAFLRGEKRMPHDSKIWMPGEGPH